MSRKKKQLDKEAIRREYAEKLSKYERLARNLKSALETFLKMQALMYLMSSIESRALTPFGIRY